MAYNANPALRSVNLRDIAALFDQTICSRSMAHWQIWLEKKVQGFSQAALLTSAEASEIVDVGAVG